MIRLKGDDGVSRDHAFFEKRADGWWVCDCNSTTGTLVNNVPVQSALLRHGDTIRFGNTILKLTPDPPIVESTYAPSPIDRLTGAFNRRHLDEQFERWPKRAKPRLVLAVFDIDRFRELNDAHGHEAGDRAIREIASLVRHHVHPGDVLARYGGDEFALLLPETTVQDAALRAEAIRAAVAAHEFSFQGRSISTTVSFGVAQVSEDTRTADDLARAAFQELHAARLRGRGAG